MLFKEYTPKTYGTMYVNTCAKHDLWLYRITTPIPLFAYAIDFISICERAKADFGGYEN